MRRPSRFTLAAGLLGFAFGGFFDGILLHQVLQWHHLLSGLDGGRLGDARVQLLADGLFHAGLYVLAVAGLLLMAGAAPVPMPAGARHRGRAFTGRFLLGFALWHGLDALVAHALLGLHRIRMDVPEPWRWDLAWLLVFGGVPAVVGVGLVRRARGPDGDGAGGRSPSSGRFEAPARPVPAQGRRGRFRWLPRVLAVLTGVAGLLVALPVTGQGTTVLVRRRGVAPGAVMAAIAASDLRLVAVDRSAAVFVVRPGGAAGADAPLAAPGWRAGVWRLPGPAASGWAGCAGWLR